MSENKLYCISGRVGELEAGCFLLYSYGKDEEEALDNLVNDGYEIDWDNALYDIEEVY